MKLNDKVTLTFGQLKRLLKETKKEINVWYVWTGDLDDDSLGSACTSLYEIVDSCQDDNSNYKQCHAKALKWLEKYVGAEFGPKDAQYVTRHFIGLNVDPNDWPPSLMFEDEKSAELVAHTLAQGTQLWPVDLYDQKFSESKQLNEYEIDDNGYDDEGNYVGMDVKDYWDRKHNAFWVGDGYDVETPYQRRKRGKYRSDWGDLPGYGDPETWGGKEPR